MFCIVAICVQIPDGFWILNTRSVSKRNTNNNHFTLYLTNINKDTTFPSPTEEGKRVWARRLEFAICTVHTRTERATPSNAT